MYTQRINSKPTQSSKLRTEQETLQKIQEAVGEKISSEARVNIMKILASSKPISKEKIQLLPYSTKKRLREMCQESENQFVCEINQLNTSVVNLIDQKLLEVNNQYEAVQLLSKIRRTISDLDLFIAQSAWNLIEQSFENVATLLNTILSAKLRTSLRFLTLTQSFWGKILEKGWAKYLMNYIDKIQKIQTNFQHQTKTLTISGAIIGFQQLNKAIKSQNKILKVVVNCYRSFYLDSDILLGSITFVVFAKNWIVGGDDLEKDKNKMRWIQLKGKNGKQHTEKALQGQGYSQDLSGINGDDGLPGNPGQSGGNFYGEVIQQGKTINLNRLYIVVSGGKGGRGQAGGDGHQGKDADLESSIFELNRLLSGPRPSYIQNSNHNLIDQRISLVSRRSRTWNDKNAGEKFTSIFKSILTFNEQTIEKYEVKGIIAGGKGGNGGKGGAGGKGGEPGAINLQKFLIPCGIKVIKSPGEVGQPGYPGQPGIGGKNGPTASRDYLNQFVAPGSGFQAMLTSSILMSIPTLGLSVAAQAVISPVCAYANSRWLGDSPTKTWSDIARNKSGEKDMAVNYNEIKYAQRKPLLDDNSLSQVIAKFRARIDEFNNKVEQYGLK